jgi:uncharacterized membrane protein
MSAGAQPAFFFSEYAKKTNILLRSRHDQLHGEENWTRWDVLVNGRKATISTFGGIAEARVGARMIRHLGVIRHRMSLRD